MINDVKNNHIQLTFDNEYNQLVHYYTKLESDDKYALIINVYSKIESDDKYALITNVYNKTDSDNKYNLKYSVTSPLIYNTSTNILSIDLSSYATQSYVTQQINNLLDAARLN
jgi:hypothetical protein